MRIDLGELRSMVAGAEYSVSLDKRFLARLLDRLELAEAVCEAARIQAADGYAVEPPVAAALKAWMAGETPPGESPAPAAVPTPSGVAKYPPHGVYEEYPCTCLVTCPSSCKGSCGCRACHAAWQDFLSAE